MPEKLAEIPCGIPVIVTEFLPTYRTEQFRFPRSKKKRIRRKWAKKPENLRKVSNGDDMYRMGDKFIVSRAAYVALRERIGSHV